MPWRRECAESEASGKWREAGGGRKAVPPVEAPERRRTNNQQREKMMSVLKAHTDASSCALTRRFMAAL
jgi:hypothetical protein